MTTAVKSKAKSLIETYTNILNKYAEFNWNDKDIKMEADLAYANLLAYIVDLESKINENRVRPPKKIESYQEVYKRVTNSWAAPTNEPEKSEVNDLNEWESWTQYVNDRAADEASGR